MADLRLITPEQLSFSLLVDLDGVATVQAKIPRDQAVQWLRMVADGIEAGTMQIGRLQP